MMAMNSVQPMRRMVNGFGNPLRLVASREPWAAALFMLSSFVLGIFWFVLLVALIGTGITMAVTLVGIPILVMAMFVWVAAAKLERRRIGALLGEHIASPYRPLPDGFFEKLKVMVTDWAVWRDLIYLVILFPIGVAEFVLLSLAVSLPIWLLTLPATESQFGVVESFAVVLLAVPVFLLSTIAVSFVGRAHAALARVLLGPGERAQLEARVTELHESRSRVMDAEMMELRRIERDLHDGAQQWLVAVAIDLAIAKEKIDSEPGTAKELIDKAGDQTRQALAEIRNLVRGISPAVLVDRGLDPAISALAARCPVPVVVDVELDERLPETVETTAYFVVSESLTNIAKHAKATEAKVIARVFGDRLLLEIVDNGVGGASPAGGTGLNGLRDRVAALDGELRVDSPVGGPTRIRAELPCGL